MQEQYASPPAPAAYAQQANLRQLQEEMIRSLYAGTGALGFVLLLLNYALPQLSVGAMLGMAVMLSLYPLHRLLARRYLGRAWLLVALWLLAGAAALIWLPASPALCLFALPVAMTALLLGRWPALVIALGISAAGALAALLGAVTLPPESWAIAAATLWGLLALLWAWLRLMEGTLSWSWQRYEWLRGQVEQARDTQADLKQAVKDLAEATSQMARLNQLLGAARRAAEEAERAKAEFVANVSHELRTPLNMIIGFSEMMLRAPQAYGRIPAALRADLAVIQRNSQHLAGLIDDVLDLSQIEAGRMVLVKECTPLHEIVSSAAEALRPLFDSRNLYLRFTVPEDLIVFCDRTRLREVLMNLLSNAGRFTEQGGVEITARVEGQEVTVSVADTGPGIAPEDQGKLFQPFQQVDGSIRRRYGGSGLGLSISKHFVEMHGGSMWLESQVGRGATISFRLPLEPAVPAEGAFQRWLNPEWEYRERTRRPPTPAPTVRPQLVVAEKGTVLQRLLRRYLSEAEITHAGNLEEATREATRLQAQALIVNDVSVGRTLEHIRQSGLLRYGMPALVCRLPGEEEAAQSLGVAGYLVKPVSHEALLAALDRLQITSGTILIVDDELDAIQLFWRMLTSSGRGYRVLTAENGRQALSILQSERPDAILLDLVMPAMDGFQLLAERRDRPAWADVPVIVMSARDPAGQPIVSDAVGITRGGGLSEAQILAYIKGLI